MKPTEVLCEEAPVETVSDTEGSTSVTVESEVSTPATVEMHAEENLVKANSTF